MKWFVRTFEGEQGGAPAGGTPAPAPAAPADPAAPAAPAEAPKPADSLADHIAKGAPPPAPAPGQPYIPEKLPEAFRGKDDRETIDKLLADVAGREAPPKEAKDYAFTPSDEFKAARGDLKDDPVIPIFQQVAHEAGLTPKQYSAVIEKFYAGLEKAGVIEKPKTDADWDKEVEKLAPSVGDKLQRMEKAGARVNAIAEIVKGLETRKEISKPEAVILSSMYASADHVVAFEKLFAALKRGGELGPQGGGIPGGRPQISESEQALRRMYPTMYKD